MVKGGVRVCGARTRSIHIRYFYATERVNNGTIVVTYCPTKEMVADYLSKPLQGSLFRSHRNTLMGITYEQADQFQMDHAAAKIARGKIPNDHLLS